MAQRIATLEAAKVKTSERVLPRIVLVEARRESLYFRHVVSAVRQRHRHSMAVVMRRIKSGDLRMALGFCRGFLAALWPEALSLDSLSPWLRHASGILGSKPSKHWPAEH